MMAFISVYITFPNIGESRKVCNALLKKRLIACVNYIPIIAASQWTGKIAECNEIVAIVKTKKENWKKLVNEIKRLHSYKVPCIMKIGVESNKEYDSWIKKETR
jgi:periplasmic divalent cation tolerance protein